MLITTDQELREAAEQAGVLLQQIQNYLEERNLGRTYYVPAKVRFPRGFLRPVSYHRDQRLTFVRNGPLKANLSYTLILTDVLIWVRMRTDLWGMPREMLTKLIVFVVGALVESITRDYLHGIWGGRFTKRSTYLVQRAVITADLKTEIDWLWDLRNRMHLFDLDAAEYENEYNDACLQRCIKAYRGLGDALRQRGRLQA